MTLPTIMTAAGLQPRLPADLRALLVARVKAIRPGFTDNLPGSLIEDIVSTDVAAIVLCDSARVDAVNSITPYGCNAFILAQLGPMLGITQGAATNTSVNVVFSGPPGFVIANGFTVTDGSHQYVAQDGGIIPAGGSTLPIFCVASASGSWAVPAGTVTKLVTSVDATIALTVNNPLAGTPATAAQTEEAYRAQVLEAERASAQGMPSYIRKRLLKVVGVQPRLVSIRQIKGVGWEVIVGGGDPYEVANAIFMGIGDISLLTGSTLAVEGITVSNPGLVTTVLNHGFATGQVINIAGVIGMPQVNNTPLTVTVTSPNTFTIGDTSAYGAYTSGGVVTPNLRNQVVTLVDAPDIYQIPYVLPPSQAVTMAVTWNTSAVNFVASAAVNKLAAQAMVTYVNSIPVGQPINVFGLEAAFRTAVADVLPLTYLTRLVFAVSINGVGVAPAAGTGVIAGDPESYFVAGAAAAVVSQG